MTNQKGYHDFAEYELFQFLSSCCNGDETVQAEPMDLNLAEEGVRFIPDIYLHQGCKALELKPKTIIEVKSRVNTEAIMQIRRIHDIFYPLFRNKDFQFVCVFMRGEIEFLGSSYLSNLPGHISDDFQVISFKELKKRVQSKSINKASLSDEDREKSNLNKARKAYLTERCSFVLGAGVSIDAGLPKWEELLKRLISEASRQNKLTLDDGDYDELFKDCGFSSIIMGRLVQTFFNDDKRQFEKAIRKALYSGSKVSPGTLAKKVCQLIKKNRSNINSIITYNYDDLIEIGLKEKKLDCVPVFGIEGHGPALPVCHVHGYLSQDENIPSKIVLSEREYHDIYRRSFHWSNVEQLHAMQQSVCFFIGLSMTDPNLRRLLDITQGEQASGGPMDIRHFAFLERNSAAGKLKGDKADEFRRKMEQMLAGLGVVVIWFDGYGAFPGILDKLME